MHNKSSVCRQQSTINNTMNVPPLHQLSIDVEGNRPKRSMDFPEDYTYVRIMFLFDERFRHETGPTSTVPLNKMRMRLHLAANPKPAVRAMFSSLVHKYNAIADGTLVIRAKNNLVWTLQRTVPNEWIASALFFNEVVVPDIRGHGLLLKAHGPLGPIVETSGSLYYYIT